MNRSRVIQLKNELHSISMQEYLSHVKRLVDKHCSCRRKCHSLYSQWLMTSYKAFKTAIRTKLTPVSLDDLYSLRCSEEVNQTTDTIKELVITDSVSPPNPHFALTTNHGHGRGRSAYSCADSTTHPWYLDSGATSHLTPDAQILQHPSEYTGNEQVLVGNGNSLPIHHSGKGLLPTPSCKLSLTPLLHIPHLTHNLFSISKLIEDNNCSVSFNKTGFLVNDLKTNQTILHGPCRNRLYPLFSHSSQALVTVATASVVSNSSLQTIGFSTPQISTTPSTKQLKKFFLARVKPKTSRLLPKGLNQQAKEARKFQYLEEISNIDHNCPLHRLDINPPALPVFPLLLDLQTPNIALQQKRQHPRIAVIHKPYSGLRFRTRRIGIAPAGSAGAVEINIGNIRDATARFARVVAGALCCWELVEGSGRGKGAIKDREWNGVVDELEETPVAGGRDDSGEDGGTGKGKVYDGYRKMGRWRGMDESWFWMIEERRDCGGAAISETFYASFGLVKRPPRRHMAVSDVRGSASATARRPLGWEVCLRPQIVRWRHHRMYMIGMEVNSSHFGLNRGDHNCKMKGFPKKNHGMSKKKPSFKERRVKLPFNFHVLSITARNASKYGRLPKEYPTKVKPHFSDSDATTSSEK
ncbi:hypothetical protein M5K25_013750 [Dendrobium thyrsiflorum]|uniref:Retrovirus-related Pol polyprotein from transposon TNT 1-94-like beta-barrel domain-containing protein n=1 Tax=Dendrobium thyrsiflorum TaxID=117978 RepID=A0ABD0V0N1_DENTH